MKGTGCWPSEKYREKDRPSFEKKNELRKGKLTGSHTQPILSHVPVRIYSVLFVGILTPDIAPKYIVSKDDFRQRLNFSVQKEMAQCLHQHISITPVGQ